jgi:predicted ATP-grasp superfamily ATP-dependent carboligase
LHGQFICKPVDAFSGRGISIFEGTNLKALHNALDKARQASPSSKAIIETFVSGDLYSCSAFVDHGKLTDAFYVREASSANPFAVDTSYVAYDLPTESIHLIESSLEKLCAFLKLANGLLHTQFILSDTQPFIVEVARRCPGDLYPLLIEYSTGFQYAAKYASYFLGEKQDARKSTRRHVLRHTVSADNEAILEGLMFKATEPVISFFPISAIGEKLRARQQSRAGILFSERSNYADLRLAYEAFLQRRAYILTSPTPHATLPGD